MASHPINKNKVSNFCAKIISDILSIDVKIVPESDNSLETRYSITPTSYSIFVATTDHDRRVKVLPIGQDLWLNFSIEFKTDLISDKKYISYLEGVTIMIFRGLASDEGKEILFRGEWDNSSDDQSKHPQPHWHVHFAKREMSEKVRKNFDELMELVSGEEEEKGGFLESIDRDTSDEMKEFSLSKFHFAMSAMWYSESNIAKHILTESNLSIWLKGCLSHIKEQIDYCLE